MEWEDIKKMTLKQFRSFRRTLEGAYYWALKHNYNPMRCSEEIKIIANAAREKTEKVSVEAMRKTLADNPGIKGRELHKKREELLGSWGYFPPYYTKVATCRICGPVMAPEDSPQEVEECILCIGGFTNKVLTSMEAVKSNGTRRKPVGKS